MKKKLVSKKGGLEVKIERSTPILYSPKGNFIPYCTMKKEPCYEHYKFKCPNYDEYMVINEKD